MERDSLLVGDEILLYGDVGDPWGWGEGFTDRDVVLALAEHGPGDVTVRLNSGGGIATFGVAIYSALKAHPGKVTVKIDGLAASAASIIAMAGNDILMREGALLMIHDTRTVAWGEAAELRRAADILDTLSAQYAGIYARRSGQAEADVRALMLAETWMSAESAIAAGFATGTIDEAEAVAFARFDYRVYAKAPEGLGTATDAWLKREREVVASRSRSPLFAAAAAKPAGSPAPKEKTMDPETPPAAPTATVVTAPPAPQPEPVAKGWAVEFFALAGKSGLTLQESNEIITACADLATAKDRVIDLLAAKQSGHVPNPAGGISVGMDARDKFVAGASQALAATAGLEKHDPQSEFRGMKPMDLVRATLQRHNIRAGLDPMKMVAAAITQSGGDFSQITFNIAEKAMLKGYEETEETFQLWTGKSSVPDFKQARRVDLNALPSLPRLTENSGYQYLTTGDRGEVYFVATAGGAFNLSRQAIINDDLDVFSKIPARLGRAAKRTVGNDVYGLLAANPVMADGTALFHNNHKNLATGGGSALSATSLQAADLAMGLQTDRSQTKVVLNIAPKHFIGPRALKYSVMQLLHSTAQLGQANPGITNPVQNIVESIITEARLDAQSATAWYLAADAAQNDTVDVIYLNGVETPYMEQDRPWDVDGVAWKVRHDYGVKAFAWEGLYKAAGA